MRRRILVVVSDRADAAGIPDAVVTTAAGYIEGQRPMEPNTTVVNLCRTLGYGSDGYYVSLLADARGHDVLPRLETNAGITDPYARFRALQEAGVATLDVAELSADADGWEAAGSDGAASVIACFGATTDTRFRSLAGAVYGVWPAPLLRIHALRVGGQWKVADLAHASPDELDAEQRELLREALTGNARALRRGTAGRERDAVRASIAVLLDDTDPFSASTMRTVERFEAVAAKLNVHVARITATDLRRLPEYDALWIRSLTDVRLPAFQFALRAEALDMPVIDDAQSIIRCSNKVFLEELLRREGLPLPRGRIVTAHTPWTQLEELGLPFVIKAPDGSFSVGVHKISSRQDFDDRARELLQSSPLLIAQEWLPTDFDWRITILGGHVLFAARYYMAQGHWQIRAEDAGVERYGKVVAVRRAEAPAAVVNIALQAAALIGDGMYGVDIKETAGGPVVIEVNDNPNLDTGYEDAADGDVIYRDIVTYFVDRIEEATEPPAAAPAPRPAPARRGRPALIASRRPRSKPAQPPAAAAARYRAFEVAGLELEYPTVDDDLNVVALVEPAFRAIAGRGTSDIELDGVGFSNEIADHVFEVKTLEPVRTLRVAEESIVAGINRFADVLRREWNARLLPTGMHPWFDPMHARLWTRSGLRIYTTYAQIFDIRTHGWMNVHATHLNLPFGDERETMAMHTASALLLPYLPALAASSPVHDGKLQPHADARLAWILEHQSRVPETCGRLVPEYVETFAAYRRTILQPMYAALDRHPNSEAIRHEFLNSRGAVLRFARRALEVRVLDTQECVRMDVAISVFTRAVLRELTADVLANRMMLPDHDVLVADFAACARDGSAATVHAPHFNRTGQPVPVREVLRTLLERAARAVADEDAGYLSDVEGIIANGTLSERIRMRLAAAAEPAGAHNSADADERFRVELRTIYRELSDCLLENRPWSGRG